MLLEEKLTAIAKALGKIDETDQMQKALEGKFLGNFRRAFPYDRLYQEAIRDPRLIRTRQELEVALDNAKTAREVVWELF